MPVGTKRKLAPSSALSSPASFPQRHRHQSSPPRRNPTTRRPTRRLPPPYTEPPMRISLYLIAKEQAKRSGPSRPPSRCTRLASPAKDASQPVTQSPHVWRIARSFGYACEGLATILRTQPNFWVHLLAGCAALALGAVLHLSPAEMALIVLTIGLVLIV